VTTLPRSLVAAGFPAFLAALATACQPSAAARALETPPIVLIPVANAEPSVRAADCPAGMILIPAGTFTMGADESHGDADEHPAHEVELGTYCIDRDEVTVARYRACMSTGGQALQCTPIPRGEEFVFFNADQLAYYDPFCNLDRTDREQHPVNCVDWHRAAAFCRWAGGRLPTEAEWEYAARGRDGRRYPWGDAEPGPKLLNGCGSECRGSQHRGGFSDATAMFEGDDGFEGTAPVGSFPAGASPFGVQDMLGNVWEWTADWKGPYPSERVINPRGPEKIEKEDKVIRGISSWGGEHAEHGLTARGGHTLSVRLAVGGFRCARSLE